MSTDTPADAPDQPRSADQTFTLADLRIARYYAACEALEGARVLVDARLRALAMFLNWQLPEMHQEALYLTLHGEMAQARKDVAVIFDHAKANIA
jgi:hypothetical protein